MADFPGWVPVKSYAAVFQADLAVALLRGAGIPARTSGDHVGIFGPGWAGTTPRGVAVLVPADRVDEAAEMLAEAPPDEPWT